MTQAPRLRTSWSRIPSEYAANFCGADWHTYVDRGNGDYLLALAFKPSAHSECIFDHMYGVAHEEFSVATTVADNPRCEHHEHDGHPDANLPCEHLSGSGWLTLTLPVDKRTYERLWREYGEEGSTQLEFPFPLEFDSSHRTLAEAKRWLDEHVLLPAWADTQWEYSTQEDGDAEWARVTRPHVVHTEDCEEVCAATKEYATALFEGGPLPKGAVWTLCDA